MGTEVDQESEFESGRLQIVVNLGTMPVRQFRDGFEFKNDLVKATKVRLVLLLEGLALVAQRQVDLWPKRNALCGEFQLQTLLIYRLQKPASHLIVNFK